MQPREDFASRPIQRLTAREVEVLRRTAAGGTNADVAEDLGVSVHAVKFHLASIFRKLDVHNRTEAAVVFLRSEG
jgi:DNA-binding CsgD family transcriptional regulator